MGKQATVGVARSTPGGCKPGLEREFTFLSGVETPPLPSQHPAEQGGAGDEPAAAISDDEPSLAEPPDEQMLTQAKAKAAMVLVKERRSREAAELLDQVIEKDPSNAQHYLDRGVAHMLLNKEKEAVQDFTVCLSLEGCALESRFQALYFRSQTKQAVGDLEGADGDLKLALDAARDAKARKMIMDHRGKLVRERVQRKVKAKAARSGRQPMVHRYRTATIEELDPDEGSEEQAEAVAHERALAWQEDALKLAAQARGKAARLKEEAGKRVNDIREENKARADRNAVRQARRRAVQEAADRRRREREEAAAAAAAAPAAIPVVLERTRVPIEVAVDGLDSDKSWSSSRGAEILEADGKASLPVGGSEEGAAAGTLPAPAAAEAAVQGPAGAGPHAGAGVAAGHELCGQPGSTEAVGAAPPTPETEQAAAAPSPEHSELVAADFQGTAAGGAAGGAAEEAEGLVEGSEEEAEDAPVAPTAAPAAAAAAEGGWSEEEGEEEALGPLPPELRPPPAALPSEEELDGLKGQADRLQGAGDHDAAEAAYAKYLVLRPADVRAWSNRAENCIQAGRFEQALQLCNEGLAVATPSHPVPRHKLLFRRSSAYRGLEWLQEALRSLEEAEAAAEAEGEERARKMLARHTAQVLAEMEHAGIQPAPHEPAAMGMPPLNELPVVPPTPEHSVPEEGELEGRAAARPAGKAAAGGAADASPPAGAGVDEAELRAQQAAAQQASAQERTLGNECFKRRQWQAALLHYRRAAELDPLSTLAPANEAAALLKLRRWGDARQAATRALELDAGNAKARYRRAHAYAGEGSHDLALLDMQMAAAAQPGDAALRRELADFERRAASQLGEQSPLAGLVYGSSSSA